MRYSKHTTRRGVGRGLSQFSRLVTQVVQSPGDSAAKMGLSPFCPRRPARRGVLLLVILALLAMFGMVAVTFVVVASQARLAAEAHQRLDEVTDPPEKLLNAGLVQVLSGSNNLGSAIGPHGLLEDVYGHEASPPTGYASGFQVFVGDANYPDRHLITTDTTMTAEAARRRVGAVLTIIDGSTRGASTRIVHYDAANSRFVLLPFPGQTVSGGNVQINGVQVQGNYFISGVPFSGTGLGWDGNQMTVAALRPGDRSYWDPTSTAQANEDYDAADFQNMLLAAVFTDINGNVTRVIPSLHRPALVRYHGSVDPNWVLRPMHSGFTGSNPGPSGFQAAWDGDLTTNTAGYQWDVDNDGDGIPDSIWVDLGFPARSSADGRMVKPLFAILCLDLDGRLNVNAHGSLAQANSTYYSMPTTSTGQQFAGGAMELRGQGYGPAEVNLGALFALPPGSSAAYQALLTGAGPWYGRYGYNGGNPVPGIAGNDTLSQARWLGLYDYTSGYWSGTTDAYGTPPDMEGTVAVGLDLAGRPIWDPSYCGQPGTDSPYELNPTRRLARGRDTGGNLADTPFSAAELERVLRGYDRDAVSLPPRLRELMAVGGIDPSYRRHDVTTDSVDVPVPSVAGRVSQASSRFVDFVALRASSLPQAQYETLFDPDLLIGRKMNLNRQLPALGEVNYLEDRQELARHLFCLAMLLRAPGYTSPWPNADSGVGGNEQYLTTRRIAQWAVNVVDFLDADSTMTPFQFDPDPFKAAGWTAPTGLPQSTENLVWGMERPDLLLTETLAFHDRRVADTEFDDSGRPANQQKRTHQETGSDPPVPADKDLDQPRMPQGSAFVELYCTNEFGAKRSSDLYAYTGGQWVLDVSRSVGGDPVWRIAITESAVADPDNNNLSQRLTSAPATFSLETDPVPSLSSGSAAPPIQIERIVSFATTAPTTNPDITYYNRSGQVGLLPGQYLLVGPRETTMVGWTEGGTPPGQPSPQRISLNPVSVTANTLGGRPYPTQGSQIKTPAAMVAAANWPGETARQIGISISEPLPNTYYPTPTETGPDGVQDWYGDPSMVDTTKRYRDKPLENTQTPNANYPIANEGMTETRTHQAYKYVLLQRLADPTQPYHAVGNPYRTVDWMPIDLTVFNGQDREPADWPPSWAVDGDNNPIDIGPWDPDDPNPSADVEFDTRERAGNNNNLWLAGEFSTLQTTTAGTSTPQAYFAHALRHSLGFLNAAFGQEWPPVEPGLTTPAAHLGDPLSPFPWVAWNNRPFANPYELLMVPATTAARFGWEYTMAPAGGPQAPYSAGADADNLHVYDHDDVGFVHLLNLFHSGGNTSELHRIFDFLAVPSRFAGAHVWLSGVTEPNHLMPTYREPGKVNLNTITSERVFRGLMNGFRESDGTLWDKFERSRRGYAAADAASYPTEFARPFRSASGSQLWPTGVSRPTPDREIEWTLLRSDPDDDEVPLFALDSTDPVNDTERNPYFRHQGLMRLANLTTTRSNVYAVWITVGFFEVSPVAADPDVYPDGWQLGRELGTDTGEIRRHRAFYVIDRSIPVGFQRGKAHNVEKTVVLRRYIE